MQEQGIACLSCGAAELIVQGSDRLPAGKWPAWEPGVQAFGCPKCGEHACWAAEPREHRSNDKASAVNAEAMPGREDGTLRIHPGIPDRQLRQHILKYADIETHCQMPLYRRTFTGIAQFIEALYRGWDLGPDFATQLRNVLLEMVDSVDIEQVYEYPATKQGLMYWRPVAARYADVRHARIPL